MANRILKPGMDRAIEASTAAAEREIQRAYVDEARRVHDESAAQSQRDMAERQAEEQRGRRATTNDHRRTRTIK